MRRPLHRSWAAVFLLLVSALQAAEPVVSPEGFAIPQPGVRFEFPRDHGSHPAFAIEWWYITGHLFAEGGQRWGFQATFFRRAAPRSRTSAGDAGGSNAFGQHQVFLAHMALLDVAGGKFLHQERLNRDGWDAWASTNTLDVRNGSWFLRLDGDGKTLRLDGGIRAEAALQLALVPAKPLVVFGTNGVSRKAADPTAASHYLTFPRLTVAGTLELDGRPREVTGEAWMDHEFSSSQLGRDQVGWDWTCIQLDDGREWMAYRMRRSDGSTDPFSTLAWIDREGRVTHLGAGEFQWKPDGEWRSPVSGAVYPARIRLSAREPGTGKELALTVEPLFPAQELTGALGGIPYWEGACRVLGPEGKVIGKAFLELTGYAASLQGRF